MYSLILFSFSFYNFKSRRGLEREIRFPLFPSPYVARFYMGSSRVIRHQASNYAQSAYQCHIKEPLLSLFGNEKQHSSGTTAAAAITFPQKLIIDQLTRKRKTKKNYVN